MSDQKNQPAEVILRRMVIGDIPAVVAIDKAAFNLPWPESSYRFELIQNPVSRCWVAECAGKIVGMLVLWQVEDEAHIGTIATHPGYRRQGIARRLLSRALVEAQKEGCRMAFLEVRQTNQSAQALYDKFGFTISGRRAHYYHDTHEDAILMTLTGIDPVVMDRLFNNHVLG